MGNQRGNKGKKKGGNPGVGIDFKKVKHKVGKKLPKAQNETDTNFKARSINLPSQGLKEITEGAAVNYQNLSLKVCKAGGPGALARPARMPGFVLCRPAGAAAWNTRGMLPPCM